MHGDGLAIYVRSSVLCQLTSLSICNVSSSELREIVESQLDSHKDLYCDLWYKP